MIVSMEARHCMGEETPVLVTTVEKAGRALGIGRSLAYDLARRGELPGVIRLGARFVVSVPALNRALGIDAKEGGEQCSIASEN